MSLDHDRTTLTVTQIAVWAARKCKFSFQSRFYNDPATIIPRSHRLFCDLTKMVTIPLRSSRPHYDHTTIYPIASRSYHASTAIIARSYHDHTTIITRSYRDLTTLPAITSHINTVLFLLFLIDTWSLSETTQSCYQKLRKGKGGGRGRGRSDSNESWSRKYMSDRLIQPESQLIAGPSR